MSKSSRVDEFFLLDIYVAIVKIRYVASKFQNAEALKHDFMAWDSIIREFEIIGEATNILIKRGLLGKSSQIIVDFRNQLIHHYFGIDAEEVWNVINDDLLDYELSIKQKISHLSQDLKEELIESFIEENIHFAFILHCLEELT